MPDQFAHAQPHDAAARTSTALDAAGNPVTTAAAQPVAADIGWKEFFVNPALQQLIQIALDNNRDLRLAALNVERTQALYRIQRADRLPSVNGSFGLQRQPSVLTGEQTSNYSIGLGITAFELDFFGRVKDLTRAALSSYMATEEAQRTAQIALVAGVANAYLGLQSLDEQLALTRATLKTREESQQLTQLQYRNGAASELDAKQADSLVYTARATLATLQRQRDVAYDALAVLLGQQPPAELIILLIEKLRNKSNYNNLFDCKYFMISTDQKLIKWYYITNKNVPAVILPSQWMSILLRYLGRSKDDFKSYVSFLNIRNRESVLSNEKLTLIIESVFELTTNIEQADGIVYNIINSKFLEENLESTDSEIKEKVKEIAKSELEIGRAHV